MSQGFSWFDHLLQEHQHNGFYDASARGFQGRLFMPPAGTRSRRIISHGDTKTRRFSESLCLCADPSVSSASSEVFFVVFVAFVVFVVLLVLVVREIGCNVSSTNQKLVRSGARFAAYNVL